MLAASAVNALNWASLLGTSPFQSPPIACHILSAPQSKNGYQSFTALPNKITVITIMTGEITSQPLKIASTVPMMAAGGIRIA
jgi:hypothetical protein